VLPVFGVFKMAIFRADPYFARRCCLLRRVIAVPLVRLIKGRRIGRLVKIFGQGFELGDI
jgi:hypothetical protein